MDRIRVNVKFSGGTHTARAAGRVASSTAGWEQAVRALQEKLGIAPDCPAALVESVSASHQVWEVDCEAARGTKEHSMRVLNLALQIADDCARSEVECYARMVDIGGGRHGYDLAEAVALSDDPEADLETARRAARYIELRGPDAFDFQLERLEHLGVAVVAFRPSEVRR